MNYKEILGRVTGFSIPVFGVSWNPPEPEVAVARRVLAFLEDRRVLYNAPHLEAADHCVRSVLDIRQTLTAEIGQLSEESPLASHLRGIRASCRKFLDDIGLEGLGSQRRLRMESSLFADLGELRATIGHHVAAIAVMYGLNVEGDLVKVLPAMDDGD